MTFSFFSFFGGINRHQGEQNWQLSPFCHRRCRNQNRYLSWADRTESLWSSRFWLDNVDSDTWNCPFSFSAGVGGWQKNMLKRWLLLEYIELFDIYFTAALKRHEKYAQKRSFRLLSGCLLKVEMWRRTAVWELFPGSAVILFSFLEILSPAHD